MSLGSQLLGLNSLYQNIVGFLCISELGISLAISYSLYDPVAKNKRKVIKGYIDYFTKFYRKVSLFIFCIGLFITPYIHIFINSNIPYMKVYFIMFVINTCITYLFSAKFCMLSVYQENYIITTVETIVNLVISILQIFILYLYPNYFLFIAVQIISKLVQMLILNIIVNKKFRWLKKEKGVLEKSKIKELYITMKGLFFHKISAMVFFATDNIVISSFLNLTYVSNFGNYYLIISGLQTIMIKIFDGITASIGNLLVENNNEKSYDIYEKSQFISFFITSIISICTLNTINIFIDIWVGHEYVIDSLSVVLLVINFYFLGMRLPIEKFKETSGIYYEDRYWAVLQAVINIVMSIIMVNIIGLPGVFLGTCISNYTIEFWVKPKLVYRKIFKKDLKDYFIKYSRYSLIGLFAFIVSNILTGFINESSVENFIIKNIINILVVLVIYNIIFRESEEYIYIKNIIFRKNNMKIKV